MQPDSALRPPAAPPVLGRRRFLAGVVATAAATVLAACGADDAEDADEPSSSAAPTSAAPDASPSVAATFPRTVDHEVGSTVIDSPPERIVAVTDGAELASLLALGVRPVGFGQRNDPLTPWIAEAGGGDPAIETYELASETNFEVLAGWRPDVIVGQYGFVTEETIDAYQAIAPTVSTSFIDWRASLRQVAAAVGRDERAEEVIAELEAEIAATGERLTGRSVAMRWVFGFPDYIGQMNDQSPIGKLLTEMGLTSLPAQLAPGEAVDQITAEALGDALDGAELVVLLDFEAPEGDGDAVLAEQALYTSNPAVAAGRVVRLTVEESNGAYFDSALTIRRNLALIERILTERA